MNALVRRLRRLGWRASARAARLVAGGLAIAALVHPASAETLGEVLRARGLAPPPQIAGLDLPLDSYQVLDDARDLLVVYAVQGRDEPPLLAAHLERASGRWSGYPISLTAARGAEGAVAGPSCRRGLALERFPAGVLIRAHVNPSAECTIVLGRDLSVRAVLAGWPVVTFADGRLVYQRNQVHFAPVHPVALGLWDPRRPRDDVSVYPREPYQAVRRAHVELMRARYTDDWCRVRNHPCEPDRFDERLAGEVVADARGDALAFVLAWEVETEAAGPPAPDASAARGVTTAEPMTEVVYVYSGLRRPGTMRHRELLRRDFEARFGPGLPRRALDADVLRALFGSAREPRPAPR